MLNSIGTMNVNNSTISGNSAPDVGGIRNNGSTVTVKSSIGFDLSYTAPLDLVGELAKVWGTNPNDDGGPPIVDPESPASSVLTLVMTGILVNVGSTRERVARRPPTDPLAGARG